MPAASTTTAAAGETATDRWREAETAGVGRLSGLASTDGAGAARCPALAVRAWLRPSRG